ncbi:MAG: RluA family pseudouridine synthase [Thiovulaceae bacterium]|nr:RluA family pseudouridine synthase [Sulfurimonadaceae bacterium]
MNHSNSENLEKTFTVTNPERLDSFLSTTLEASRNQVAQMIKKSLIKVNTKICTKPGLKLKTDDTIIVTFPKVEPSKPLEIDFDVDVIFEDEHILVINKPSGVTVHPAPSVKEPTLVEWLKHKNISLSTLSGEERHGIVHRLDKGTSGAMVVAKTNEAHEKLSAQLMDRSMGRYYIAVIDMPLKDNMIVERPIGRNSKNRLKMGITSAEKGKSAKTAFAKVSLNEAENVELIACKLYSGRTHQIRVHLESISRRIVGDDLYGFKSKKDKIDRIFLHAFRLYLIHPISGEPMEFTAPLPAALEEGLTSYFNGEDLREKLTPSTIEHLFDDMDDWMYVTTQDAPTL